MQWKTASQAILTRRMCRNWVPLSQRRAARSRVARRGARNGPHSGALHPAPPDLNEPRRGRGRLYSFHARRKRGAESEYIFRTTPADGWIARRGPFFNSCKNALN